MRTLVGTAVLFVWPTFAGAQPQPAEKPGSGSQVEIDTQARTAPGTITSPNPGNAAIAKIEAAGKNPNVGPAKAQVNEPSGPGSAENNSGGR